MAPETLLPTEEATEVDADPTPEVVALDSAGAVIEALGSDTARTLVSSLHDEPRTVPDLADAVDTSTQNVHYHLERLRAAGLVRVVDTLYSANGVEMDVYAPASDPLLMVAGEAADDPDLREAIRRTI